MNTEVGKSEFRKRISYESRCEFHVKTRGWICEFQSEFCINFNVKFLWIPCEKLGRFFIGKNRWKNIEVFHMCHGVVFHIEIHILDFVPQVCTWAMVFTTYIGQDFTSPYRPYVGESATQSTSQRANWPTCAPASQPGSQPCCAPDTDLHGMSPAVRQNEKQNGQGPRLKRRKAGHTTTATCAM